MSKIKLLLDVVHDLQSLAGSIQALVHVMEGNESTVDEQPETPVPAEAPKFTPKAITLEQVRQVLAEKSQDGFTAEVRALLTKHGGAKLSEVDSANYAALFADAERLK